MDSLSKTSRLSWVPRAAVMRLRFSDRTINSIMRRYSSFLFFFTRPEEETANLFASFSSKNLVITVSRSTSSRQKQQCMKPHCWLTVIFSHPNLLKTVKKLKHYVGCDSVHDKCETTGILTAKFVGLLVECPSIFYQCTCHLSLRYSVPY
jgi:hypothetical protein